MSRRVLLFLFIALVSCVAGTARADLPPMTPCAPPTSGVAYPVTEGGLPIAGGIPVPFHLAYVCVPPCLFWGGLAMTGNAYDTSTFNTPIGVLPTTVIHFYEDEWGRCWAKVTVFDGDPVVQTDSWFRVTSP